MKISLARRWRRRIGFTLAEVLIAMFVLTVGIAGVTASLWWATKNQGAGREMTEASNHGRVLMEALISSMEVNWTALKGGNAWPDQNSGVNDAAGTRRDVYAAPFVGLEQSVTGQSLIQSNLTYDVSQFKRNITVTRQGAANTYDFGTCIATVRIYWNTEKGRERSVAIESIIDHSLGSGKP